MIGPSAGGYVARAAARFVEDALTTGGHNSAGETLHVDGGYHTLGQS
jgi:hypothetical protein